MPSRKYGIYGVLFYAVAATGIVIMLIPLPLPISGILSFLVVSSMVVLFSLSGWNDILEDRRSRRERRRS